MAISRVYDHTETWVLRMALAEYIVARTPAEYYVATRYKHMDENFRVRKLADVKVNLDAAAKLRSEI